MFLNFERFRIWIPSIMALMGIDNLELVKNKNNKSLKVKSNSKQYVKGMNESKGRKTRFYTRNK